MSLLSTERSDTVSISEPGYIELPSNISELNDYMCGPMKREDLLCIIIIKIVLMGLDPLSLL